MIPDIAKDTGKQYILQIEQENIFWLKVILGSDIIMADDDDVKWEDLSQELKDKRVLLLYGQNLPIDSDEVNLINDFCERYDVVVANEHITNRHVNSSIKSAVILSMIDWNEYCPDVVITMGGHRMVDPKDSFRSLKERINHWHVSRDGNVSDPFHCQTKIIECSQKFFFRKMSSLSQKCAHPYLAEWRKMETEKIKRTPTSEDFSYSGVYAIKRLVESIPKGSLLHISNSCPLYFWSFFFRGLGFFFVFFRFDLRMGWYCFYYT